MKLGILASGNLGYSLFKQLHSIQNLIFVMTDNSSFAIIEHSRSFEIDIFIGNPNSNEAKSFYQSKEIDVLISINYIFLIDCVLINHPKILAFNLHGSLLPKYKGRTPHVWSIINGETETGITAHLIDEGCDTGPIIYQETVSIEASDTGASILQKFSKKYLPLILKVLKSIEKNDIEYFKQDSKLGSFFPKRKPSDGLIDWNWQKQQIKNWIRAQAYPYPGAFTFMGNDKLTIDKILFNDIFFSPDIPNGLVISVKPFLVKTPNGVVEIISYREVNKVKIKQNIVLGSNYENRQF